MTRKAVTVLAFLLAFFLTACAGSSQDSSGQSAGNETQKPLQASTDTPPKDTSAAGGTTQEKTDKGVNGTSSQSAQKSADTPQKDASAASANTEKKTESGANVTSSQSTQAKATQEKTTTQTTQTTKKALPVTDASQGTQWLPPLPRIFDVPLDANPQILLHRLAELGYTRTNWTLDAPYSRLSFTLDDDAATFRKVDVLICNNPSKIAKLSIQGKDPDNFYEAVKKRFDLGITEWEKDDRADFRHGKYERAYEGHTKAVLNSDRHGTELLLEAEDVTEECQRALAKDIEDLSQSAKAELDAQRKRQRETF